MKVKKQVEIDIFEEDDWIFDDVPNTEYFGEDLSDFYTEPKVKLFGKIVFLALWWIVSLVGVLFIIINISLKVSKGTDGDASRLKSLSGINTLQEKLDRVDGESITSEELISISSIFSEYTYVLNTCGDLTSLNNLCEESSSYAKAYKQNRDKSKYSLDEYDCTARAYSGITSKIKLNRVNDVIYKDGLYYCYVNLTVPDASKLFEYYLKYSYEMTQFLSVHDISMTSISDYVNQTIGYSDYPEVSKEFSFVVTKKGDSYVLSSDEQFVNICDSVFDKAVNQVIEISGTRLSKENLN